MRVVLFFWQGKEFVLKLGKAGIGAAACASIGDMTCASIRSVCRGLRIALGAIMGLNGVVGQGLHGLVRQHCRGELGKIFVQLGRRWPVSSILRMVRQTFWQTIWHTFWHTLARGVCKRHLRVRLRIR